MNEKQLFEDNKVLLWGVRQANKKLLEEYDKGNKNPHSRKRKEEEDIKETSSLIPKKQVKRVFDPEADYSVKDLPFLESEYERLEDELSKVEDLEKMDELDEIQEKIINLIEGLKHMLRLQGKGVHNIPYKPSVEHYHLQEWEPHGEDSFYNNRVKTHSEAKGKGFKKGSPEALAQAEKMRKAREAKYPKVEKTPVVKKTSKARVEKGSEEAKALSQRLAEARRKKAEERKKNEPVKQEPVKKSSLKPWYYLGDVPKGYREATEDEAIFNHKVSKYGKYVVDKTKYEMFELYGLRLTREHSDRDLTFALNGTKKRIMKSLQEIEILKTRVNSDKYSKSKEDNEEKLEDEENKRKMLQAGWNWLFKEYCQRNNKEYVKQKFELPKKEVITPTKTKIIRSTKPVHKDPRREITELEFQLGDKVFTLDAKYFNDELKLLPKYAKSLFKKQIILEPKHYMEEDINKYFGKYIKEIRGSGVLSFDGLKDAFKGFQWATERAISSAKGYVFGRGDALPPEGEKILAEYADQPIISAYVNRNPVQQGITEVMNALTLGKFKKRMERKSIDQLFHLALIVKLQNGKSVVLEKNEKINVSLNTKRPKDSHRMGVLVPQGITLGSLIEGGKSILGDKFYTYAAVDNNCQDFIMALLKGSNMGDAEVYTFVKQDTMDLFKGFGYLKNISNTVTDLAGRMNEIVLGAGLGAVEGEGFVNRVPDKSENHIVQSIVFMRDQGWTVPQAKKWLKDNDYFYDEVDKKPNQIRFRQYNPEDLKVKRHYISEKIEHKGKEIILVISMKNMEGGKINWKKMNKISQSLNKANPAMWMVKDKKTSKVGKDFGSTAGKANRAGAPGATQINPMHQFMNTRAGQKLGIQLGETTDDYLLPATVEAGKPLYYGAAMTGSTMTTGNPYLGMMAAKQLWNTMGAENDPSKNQKSKELGIASKVVGTVGAKSLGMGVKKRGRPRKVVKVQFEEPLEYQEYSHTPNKSLEQLIKARLRKGDKQFKKDLIEIIRRVKEGMGIGGMISDDESDDELAEIFGNIGIGSSRDDERERAAAPTTIKPSPVIVRRQSASSSSSSSKTTGKRKTEGEESKSKEQKQGTGLGKRPPKGSPEMREYMAKLRSMRKK